MKKRILFQGDSITDAGRNREDFYSTGYGYAHLVTASLGADNPGKYEFVNRGIGGDLLVDLYNRLEPDFLELKPDYASIFIGTNDAWAELDQGRPIETEAFEQMYVDMLERIYAACPNMKLMLFGPAIMEGQFSQNTTEQPDRLNQFRAHVASRIDVVRRIARQYELPFVDVQAVYDAACQLGEAACWTGDGAHPTPAGHELLKRAWLDAFDTIKEC